MAILKTPITPSDHIRGPAHAPITLVEYGDYQCPHCALAHPIVNRAQSHFRERMRFVFRHFPLTEVNPYAEIAAESAEFAGAAGLFWDMHDALYENQDVLNPATILLIGAGLGLPETEMREALETGRYRKKQGAQRLHERRAQRREWNPDVLHQWRTPRRLLRLPLTGSAHPSAPRSGNQRVGRKAPIQEKRL